MGKPYRRRLRGRTIKVNSMKDRVNLYFITDTHLGNIAVDEDCLQNDIARVQDDPHAYWISGGDMIEAINPDDKRRFDPSVLAEWVDFRQLDNLLMQQIGYYRELFRPIAHKCLAVIKGNHEDAARKYTALNPYYEMVINMGEDAGLKAKDNHLGLGWGDYLVLSICRQQERHRFVGWFHHGYGGGRKAGAHALNLEYQLERRSAAQLIVMGHRHRFDIQKDVQDRLPGKSKGGVHWLEERQRIGMWMPGYMRGHIDKNDRPIPIQNYTEEKALKPLPVGVVPISIHPSTLQMTIEVTA
jgi:hypothetical protein